MGKELQKITINMTDDISFHVSPQKLWKVIFISVRCNRQWRQTSGWPVTTGGEILHAEHRESSIAEEEILMRSMRRADEGVLQEVKPIIFLSHLI